MTPEFRAFPKIPNFNNLGMYITQKIHGTNALIYITEDKQIFAASRRRYLTVGDDNHGFAKWVNENTEALITHLGPGHHYGEWAGPGISNGEGLTEKTLFLFNWRRWNKLTLPQVRTVPLLYAGKYDSRQIAHIMEGLKEHGSFAVDGFMLPEGIVIEMYDPIKKQSSFSKQTFTPEEIKWKGIKKIKVPRETRDVDYLLQPVRLEKLLSSDEIYLRQLPTSLPDICKHYVGDLTAENQFKGTLEEQEADKKALGRHVFMFVKAYLAEKGYAF